MRVPRVGLTLPLDAPASAAAAGATSRIGLVSTVTLLRHADGLARVRGRAEEAGREPDACRGAVFLWTVVDDDAEVARRTVVERVSRTYAQDFSGLQRYLVSGTPEGCAARIREYVDAGAEDVVISPAAPLDGPGLELVAEVRRQLVRGAS